MRPKVRGVEGLPFCGVVDVGDQSEMFQGSRAYYGPIGVVEQDCRPIVGMAWGPGGSQKELANLSVGRWVRDVVQDKPRPPFMRNVNRRWGIQVSE